MGSYRVRGPVHAAYLYRFAGYVEWPDASLAGRPFIIATFDSPEIAQALRHLLPGHPIQGRIAEVREITRVQDVSNAQVLYVGRGHPDFLAALAASGYHAVLLVTADDRGLDLGSVLNFVTVDKRGSIRDIVDRRRAGRPQDQLGTVVRRDPSSWRAPAIRLLVFATLPGRGERLSLRAAPGATHSTGTGGVCLR
jgi:hypothetical protein